MDNYFVALYKGKYVLITSVEDVDSLAFNGTVFYFKYINSNGTIEKKEFEDYDIGDTFKRVPNAKIETYVTFKK